MKQHIMTYEQFLNESVRESWIAYPDEKDRVRIQDIIRKANGDTGKEAKLAAQMVNTIKDAEKMKRRYQAALNFAGFDSPITDEFAKGLQKFGVAPVEKFATRNQKYWDVVNAPLYVPVEQLQKSTYLSVGSSLNKHQEEAINILNSIAKEGVVLDDYIVWGSFSFGNSGNWYNNGSKDVTIYFVQNAKGIDPNGYGRYDKVVMSYTSSVVYNKNSEEIELQSTRITKNKKTVLEPEVENFLETKLAVTWIADLNDRIKKEGYEGLIEEVDLYTTLNRNYASRKADLTKEVSDALGRSIYIYSIGSDYIIISSGEKTWDEAKYGNLKALYEYIKSNFPQLKIKYTISDRNYSKKIELPFSEMKKLGL